MIHFDAAYITTERDGYRPLRREMSPTINFWNRTPSGPVPVEMGLTTKTNSPLHSSHLFFLPPKGGRKNKWERRQKVLCVLVSKPISTGTGPDGAALLRTFNYG